MNTLKPSFRFGFTLVELLVVIAIIGVLMAMTIPAVQSIRETARQSSCLKNLREIATATTNFYTSRPDGAFPPARIQPAMVSKPMFNCGGKEPSWLVRILPYIEQENLYEGWDVSRPYNLHPEDVKNTPVELFCCPTRRSVSTAVAPDMSVNGTFTLPCGCAGTQQITVVGGASGDYAGNHGDPSPGSTGGPDDFWRGGNGTGVIISSRARCVSDSTLITGQKPGAWIDRIKSSDIKDGLSHTFLVGELHVQPDNINQMPFNGPIFNGEDLTAFARIGGPTVPIASHAYDEPGPILGFGSWHPGVTNFAMADGSVRSVSNLIDTETLGRLCHRADGLPIKNEF